MKRVRAPEQPVEQLEPVSMDDACAILGTSGSVPAQWLRCLYGGQPLGAQLDLAAQWRPRVTPVSPGRVTRAAYVLRDETATESDVG